MLKCKKLNSKEKIVNLFFVKEMGKRNKLLLKGGEKCFISVFKSFISLLLRKVPQKPGIAHKIGK